VSGGATGQHELEGDRLKVKIGICRFRPLKATLGSAREAGGLTVEAATDEVAESVVYNPGYLAQR